MIYFYGDTLFNHFTPCTQEDIKLMISESNIISIDIETSRKFKRNRYDERVYKPGLDPFMSKICMIQLYNGKNSFIIDARVKDIKFLVPMLENESILKIGHNLQFEAKFFKVILNTELRNVWDTMICEKVLYNGFLHSYSLAGLADRYLGKKANNSINLFDNSFHSKVTSHYNEMRNTDQLNGSYSSDKNYYEEAYHTAQMDYIDKSTRMGFVNMGDRPFTVKEIEYGAADVVDPYNIYLKQREGWMTTHGLYKPTRAFDLQNKVVPLLAEMSMEGIYVDAMKWIKVYESNFLIKCEYEIKINEYVINNHPNFVGSIDLFSSEPTCAINWGSSKQVIQLFKSVDRCPQEFSKATKRKEWTVGAVALFKTLTKDQKGNFYKTKFPEIKTFSDFILAYLIYKKYEQLTTTFGKDWLRFIHPITGKIHSNFNQYMSTGRMSSTRPNQQNIPASKLTRACFYTDGKMVCADYSSQESRILAEVSRVPKLIKFFAEGDEVHGKDFHSFIATMMYRSITGDNDLLVSKKNAPDKRQIAKALNFLMAYGGSAYSLKDKLSSTEEEAEEFITAWFESMPGLKEYFKRTMKVGVERGWIEICPITKARYFYPDFNEMNQILVDVNKLKPANYDKLSYDDKQIVKEKLRKETDWSKLWRRYLSLKGRLERKSLNYAIQGLASVQTKVALILAREKGLIPINIIHDEILAKYQREGDDELLSSVMKQGAEYFVKLVPMDAEAEIADHWVH